MIESGNLAVAVDPTEDQLETFRQEAHELMDDFIDKMAPHLTGKPMNLTEISNLFQRERTELLGKLIEGFVRSHHLDLCSQELAPCPRCGRQLKARPKRAREVDTAHGTVTLERPYFYCGGCKLGFSPLDTALELCRERKQHDLQRKALKLLAEVPFERASSLFEELTGIPFSDHSMHELFANFTDEMKIEDVLPSREQIEERIDRLSRESRWRPILVVASDGAMVPLRPKARRDAQRGPGKYQEAKGFRLYLVGRDRIVHLASWHQVQDAEELIEDIRLIAQRVPTEKVRIALLGDGASWLWRAMGQAFPTGKEILDFYHCSEHLHALAGAQYAGDCEAATEWVEASIVRLFYGKVSDVVGGLKRMKPSTSQAKEEIRKLITYLSHNRQKIHYRSDRLGGYPIGSGGIESAHKFICHVRLKRSGAWWIKTNSNGMLKLRCSIYNGTFDEVFSRHLTRQKAKRFLTKA